MDTIMEMIRHVVVFLLIASLIGNLLVEGEYRKYISYATGLIVMILVLVPVLSLVEKKNNWQDYLVQADYRQETENTRRDIALLGEKYEKELEERYEKTLQTEIAQLCEVPAQKCHLHMREGKVESIHVEVPDRKKNMDFLRSTLSLRYGIEKKNIFFEEES